MSCWQHITKASSSCRVASPASSHAQSYATKTTSQLRSRQHPGTKTSSATRYYLELMQHKHVPGQDAVNRAVLELSKTLDIPSVVTNDCHYVHPHDAKHQDTLMCILTSSKLAQSNRLRMEDDSYYVKSADEMYQMFGEVPDALVNTLEIAERCNIEIGSDRVRLPKIEVPEGLTSEQYLRQVCYEGARQRFGDLSDTVRERLDSELHIIESTDFADYFLVVWDIFKFVKQAGILSTVRGSAASSLALYCLNVIDFNPLEYGLVFERFLNVERREMPDIDMEFADDRRKEVIGYCLEKYGSDRVAQIGTFGTMLTRSAIRDSARVMEDGQHDNGAVQTACNRLVKIANDMAQSQMQPDDEDAGPPELNLTTIHAALRRNAETVRNRPHRIRDHGTRHRSRRTHPKRRNSRRRRRHIRRATRDSRTAPATFQD